MSEETKPTIPEDATDDQVTKAVEEHVEVTKTEDPMDKMAKMMEAMRVYESYQKTIQSLNDTMEQANDQLGKLSV